MAILRFKLVCTRRLLFPIFVKGAVSCCFSFSRKLVAVVIKCSHVEIRFLCIGRLTTAVKEGHDGWPDAGSYEFTTSQRVCLESALVRLCELPACLILWTLFLAAYFVKNKFRTNLFYIIFWNSSHSFSGLPCPDANPNCFIFSRPDKGSRNRHVKPVVSSWGGPSNLKKKVLRPRRLCQHVRSSRTSFHRPRALVVRLESLRWLLCMF